MVLFETVLSCHHNDEGIQIMFILKQQGRFLHKFLALPGVCNLCLHCLVDAVVVTLTFQSLLCTQRFLEDSEHGLV